VALIATRDDIKSRQSRQASPGIDFTKSEDDGKVSNLYQITLINKTFESQKSKFKTKIFGKKVGMWNCLEVNEIEFGSSV